MNWNPWQRIGDGTNSPHAEFIDIDYNRENPIILMSGKDLIHKCPNALTEIHSCQGICCDACHEERIPKTKGRSSQQRGDRDMLAMSVTDKSVSPGLVEINVNGI